MAKYMGRMTIHRGRMTIHRGRMTIHRGRMAIYRVRTVLRCGRGRAAGRRRGMGGNRKG